MNYINIYTFLPKCEEISEMCTAWSKEKIRKYLIMACSLPINLIKFMMKVIEKELGFPKGLNILTRANFLAKFGLFTWNVSITRNVDKLNLINEKMRNFREKDIKIFCYLQLSASVDYQSQLLFEFHIEHFMLISFEMLWENNSFGYKNCKIFKK